MSGQLVGRVAVITGAAGAIGAATAAGLVASGASVLLMDSRGGALSQAATRIAGAESSVIEYVGDAACASEVRGAVALAQDHFGAIDIVLPFAGVVGEAALQDVSESEWRMVIDLNLYGAMIAVQATQQALIASDQGRVILMSSVAAGGARRQSAYSASKAGIKGLCRSLAAELGVFGITVNSISPGFIESRLTRAIATQEGISFDAVRARYGAATALGRVGTPEDVAGLVCFLAGSEAGYISGQDIAVDGGPVGWRT